MVLPSWARLKAELPERKPLLWVFDMMSEVLRAQPILIEGAPDGISALRSHWEAEETFAYIPQKSSVPRDWVADCLNHLPEEYRKDHFCLLTSGSTGNPKLVVGRKQRSERLAVVLHEVQRSEPVRETIVSLPLTYCYAFVNQWLWSKVFGRRLLPTHGFSQPDVFLEALKNSSEAMLCLVGPQVTLLTQMFGGKSFPGVIRVHFAGGRFPQERVHLLGDMFPNAKIFNNYGCAEAMPRLTLRLAEDGDQAADIGLPLPGVQLKTNEAGQLFFLSDYRGVAQIDVSGFRAIADDEWMPSGDLAEKCENNHWQLLGRTGEVFKRYGEKIALPQILATVNEHWNGQVGYYREKDGAGEDGYVLVLSPVPPEDQIRLLLRAFRASHPRTHWPLRIESTAALPLLANEKVNSLALKDIEGKSTHWRQRI